MKILPPAMQPILKLLWEAISLLLTAGSFDLLSPRAYRAPAVWTQSLQCSCPADALTFPAVHRTTPSTK